MKRLKRICCFLQTNQWKKKQKEPDASNAKENYQSFIRKKTPKWDKQSKIITDQEKLLKTETLLI